MITIGVDESGTGAWAGPFTVCAIALHESDHAVLRHAGVRDSKKISDEKRRNLVDMIVEHAIAGSCEFAEVEDIRKHGQKQAWRNAAAAAITQVANIIKGRVVIDGLQDDGLKQMLSKIGVPIIFMVKADDAIPAVSAASIVAKTMRNDRMVQLHQRYPEYNWKQNAGYGSDEHQNAIESYGKTIWHRPVKNLESVYLRTHLIEE